MIVSIYLLKKLENFNVKLTFLEDKYLIPSATCQENFISGCDVRLV